MKRKLNSKARRRAAREKEAKEFADAMMATMESAEREVCAVHGIDYDELRKAREK